MLSSIKEPKNIPVSTSLLHDQEYNNLCLLRYIKKKTNIKVEKRRAFSEKNTICTNPISNINNEQSQKVIYTPRIKAFKSSHEPNKLNI